MPSEWLTSRWWAYPPSLTALQIVESLSEMMNFGAVPTFFTVSSIASRTDLLFQLLAT